MASRTDARLMKSTKFPPEFSKKVDMQKVNLQVMKKWIASRISEILGNEDDVVIELCFNLVDGPRYPDIKALQIQLTGFLDKDTAPFCKELWKLFLSAQDSPQGVPKELLEAKKLELMQEKHKSDESRDRGGELPRRGRDGPGNNDSEWRNTHRDRGDNWQGRRNDRGFDQRGRAPNSRPYQRSQSPDRRHRQSRDAHPRDSYVPPGRDERGDTRGRGRRTNRSPLSKSRSRSPPRRRRDSPRRDQRTRKRSWSRSVREDSRRSGRREDSRDSNRGRSRNHHRHSPSPKRRRYSSSRSRSSSRGRTRSVSSSRSGSLSPSRTRSRSDSADESDRPRKERPERSRSSSREPAEGRPGRSGKREIKDRPAGRRRNSSSVSRTPA